MTAKGFFLGILVGIVVGIPLAFYNAILATLLGVGLGALLGSSKKSGGAVGLICSPSIYLSPLYIPLLLKSPSNMLPILIIIGGSFMNIVTTIVVVVSLIVGILVGHMSMKLTRVQSSKGVY